MIGVVTPSGGAGGGGGATYLDALTDVSLSSPSNGQVLKYNRSQWPNQLDDTSSGGPGSTSSMSLPTSR
jgi:hypothetical protein